jgi:hypothetical protein
MTVVAAGTSVVPEPTPTDVVDIPSTWLVPYSKS